ncbi:MAG: hypothetical protein LC791_00620 [Acidobacteria bacterium]|nr:hypothetical protein [Acidobacteriota bacterium]
MSDRKYRQRGYQDDDRDRPRGPRPDQPRPEREPGAPAGARRISSEGARNPKMMGYREVARCTRCGSLVDAQVMSRSTCGKCGLELRSCIQCVSFDPGTRFECTEKILARVSPKDTANDCPLYSARASWERETTTATTNNPAEPSGARKAFDDLFKF